MFGLGAWEIIVILALALIVLGPQKLPELAKQLARMMGELRRVADDVKTQFDDATYERPPPPALVALPPVAHDPAQDRYHEGAYPGDPTVAPAASAEPASSPSAPTPAAADAPTTAAAPAGSAAGARASEPAPTDGSAPQTVGQGQGATSAGKDHRDG